MAQHELRLTARAKFSRAMDMVFTRGGYEQSTSEPVAGHRARRFAGTARVADLCCGIGGDVIALAAGREVLAVDRDPVHARLAEHNAGVYGVAGNVTAHVADVRDADLTGVGAVFIDPARRAGGGDGPRQRFRAGTSEPPLEWCFELATDRSATARSATARGAAARRVPAVCVKAAPGIDTSVVPAGWEAEFVADGRDLKEAVLWSPALATTTRRATIIASGDRGAPPAAAVVHALTPSPGPGVRVAPPGEYLYDPSPAVTRAGLVEDLARLLGAWKIDEQIAFLSTDAGAADLRRRGLAGDVDAIRRRLRLAGPHRATIVLTRVADQPWGLICADPGTPLARSGAGKG
jgi:hypothetical protein